MARIRTIKPEFFTSESILAVSPLARLFFIGLWCEADREGRLKWKPRTLKFRYLPADSVDVETLCDELESEEMISIYTVDNVDYCEIPGFKSHQVINNRERESEIPLRVGTREPRVKAEGRKEGKGREGKGKEGKDKTLVDSQENTTYPTDAEIVFQCWQSVMDHRQAKLDDKRKKLINAALKTGYSVRDLQSAISGCSLTPHNMGKNSNNQRYDGLHIILKPENIDRFISANRTAGDPTAGYEEFFGTSGQQNDSNTIEGELINHE